MNVPSGTKDKIIDCSLRLFSKKGYSGVSVKEIAAAVGIKDSSLYKHFKSKREIFDTILTQMTARMDELTAELHIADAYEGDVTQYYTSLTMDDLIMLSKQLLLFYLTDPFAAEFRRMLTIEQYNDSEISGIYKKIFLEYSIAYQTVVFKQLSDCGYFKKKDPKTMAVNFYAPIFYIITRFDGDDEHLHEALDMVENHVREFSRIYLKKTKA